MSVEFKGHSLRIIDNQLGGRIIVFISPITRQYEIYLQDVHGRFIKRLNSIKICSILSVSYCESVYNGRNILIDIMKCRDIYFTELHLMVKIPREVFTAYAFAKATGNYKTYYELVDDTLRELRGRLENRINELITLNYGEIDNIIANYFNSELLDYSKEIGTWITSNPLYEESRLYGRYCHNCVSPYCSDIERVITTQGEQVMAE